MSTLTVSPTSVTVGDTFVVAGTGFGNRRTVSIYSNDAFVFSFRSTRAGSFSKTMTSQVPTGPHVIKAMSSAGSASATVQVNAVNSDPAASDAAYDMSQFACPSPDGTRVTYGSIRSGQVYGYVAEAA